MTNIGEVVGQGKLWLEIDKVMARELRVLISQQLLPL